MIVTEGSLEIHYGGLNENLSKHQMNAKLVAKSISAIDSLYCEAFNEANKLFKNNVKTEVYIEGGFKEGSIWWLCRIFGKQNEQQLNIYKNENQSFVSSAIQKVFSILKLIPVEEVDISITETNDGYEIIINDEPIKLDEYEASLLSNTKIRAAISDLASPLNEEGIDSLTITDLADSHNTIKVSDSDKHGLIVLRKHKHILDFGTVEGLYYVEDLSYNPLSTWKLISHSNPSLSITAKITDPAFLKSVSDNNENFSKDDLLLVKGSWYKQKHKYSGKTSTIYTITEVEDHIKYNQKQWKLV